MLKASANHFLDLVVPVLVPVVLLCCHIADIAFVFFAPHRMCNHIADIVLCN